MSTGARSNKNSSYFQAVVPKLAWSMSFGSVAAKSARPVDGAQTTGTTLIRVIATQDCHIAVGPDPVAAVPVADGVKLDRQVFVKGNALAYIGVEPGWYVSVIQDTVAGVLNVTEAD